jgi:hypothetical protein
MAILGNMTINGAPSIAIEAAASGLLAKLRESGKKDIKAFTMSMSDYPIDVAGWIILNPGTTDVFDGTSTEAVVDVHSTSDADGTGNKQVRLWGLDVNGDLTSEVITFTDTAGTVDVMTTTTEWTRLIMLEWIDTAGTITVTENGDVNDLYLQMDPSYLSSLNTLFWVPAGKEAMLGFLLVQPPSYNLVGVTELQLGVAVDSSSSQVNVVMANGFCGRQQAIPLEHVLAVDSLELRDSGTGAANFSVDAVYWDA